MAILSSLRPEGRRARARAALPGGRLPCLALAVALLAGGALAQAAVEAAEPAPMRWFDLTLVGPGLAILVPADWAYERESGWHLGDDRRFVIGWAPEAPGGAARIAEDMKKHVESSNPVSALTVEALPGGEAGSPGFDLLGTHTDGSGGEHWQWTRLLDRADGSIVLLSAQGDFADAERIAETREQLALTFSSLLSAARPEGDEGDYTARTADDLLGLGQLGPWAVLEQLWGHPKIHADLVVSVGLAGGETSGDHLAERLLVDERADTRLELEVVADADDAAVLVYRVVGHEPEEADEPAYAMQNERVRWTRCAFAPGTDGVWVLRAALDLRVTHADEFLDNAMTGLEPVFEGWSVTPLGEPDVSR